MKFGSVAVTAATAFATTVSGLALPFDGAALATRQTLSPQLVSVAENASYLLGWQLAGIAQSVSQLGDGCNSGADFVATIAAVGLIPALVKQPVCNAWSSKSIPSVANNDLIPYIYQYNTQIFLTQILSSFTQQSQFASLCTEYLDYRLLDSFNVASNIIMPAVCAAGNANQIPETVEPPFSSNQPQIYDFLDAVSQVFGYQVLAGATDNADLTYLCGNEPAFESLLEDQHLNGGLIKHIFCDNDSLPGIALSQQNIATASTTAFTIALQHVSGKSDYSKWLCQNLDQDSMDSVGLQGAAVVKTVCSA